MRKIWSGEMQRGTQADRQQVGLISAAVNAGKSVTEAVQATEDYFPSLLREMVQVGEQAGQLDQSMLRLADHYDHQLALRRTFLTGITWPLIELGLAVFVIGGLILLMGVVGQMTGQMVDVLGFGLIGVRGLVVYIILVGAVVGMTALLMRAWMRGKLWTAPLQKAAMRIPVLGVTLETMALSQMAWTLSLTTNTSLNIRRALELSQYSTHQVHFTQYVRQVDRVLQRGEQIHVALRGTGAYPEEFLDAIEVGEQSGLLPESMAGLSRQYEDRARAALKTLSVVAGVAVMILVAMIIGAMILRIVWVGYIGPYRELLNDI